MKRKIALLALPLLLVVLAEFAFRCGAWELLAEPDSHAGSSVRLKQDLLGDSMPRIDFVTLGSSRPVYGIDHALLAVHAQESGFMHANLSMAGSHWMTVGVVAKWLERHRPEIRGGIIALSIQDMTYAGNGSYELGIVQPFREASEQAWIEAHVPFSRNDIESYGSRYALYGWREDIRNMVLDPFTRISKLLAYRNRAISLFTNPESQGDICALGDLTPAICDAFANTNEDSQRIGQQCLRVRSDLQGRPDFRELMKKEPLPDFMQRTRDLIQSQLRDMHWQVPPVVVLMPVPRIWLDDGKAAGQHAWALSVLQPLADEGSIRLIDATYFFDSDSDQGCSQFFDLYHQNADGRTRFTRWLLPQIEGMLYAGVSQGTRS